MIIDPDITKLNITEEIINHFFSKTKLSEHNITNITLIRTNKISHLLRLSLEPSGTLCKSNKASNQPKRTQTTLEININKLRDYKLNKLLNTHNNETI
jgi:hypothetical protein